MKQRIDFSQSLRLELNMEFMLSQTQNNIFNVEKVLFLSHNMKKLSQSIYKNHSITYDGCKPDEIISIYIVAIILIVYEIKRV
jgi:hypothetical protein